jgi:hypothetical protein
MRMPRFLYWISLAPFACVVAMWFVAISIPDDVVLWSHRGQQHGSHHDSLQVTLTPYHAVEVAFSTGCIWVDDRNCGLYNLRTGPAILGIYIGAVADPGSSRTFVVMLPFWLMGTLTAAGPAAHWLRRELQDGRADWRWLNGKCTACGYDLRGSPDRCPECGKDPLPPPVGISQTLS